MHGLPAMQPLQCEHMDPHCEGPSASANPLHGTGEPMTAVAMSLYNVLHPNGYKVSAETLALAVMPEKVVQSKFLALDLTANGNEAKFSDLYNFVSNSRGFSIGSASQDYITNTHGKYFPYPGDKLVNIHLGSLARSSANSPSHGRLVPPTRPWQPILPPVCAREDPAEGYSVPYNGG